jgi:MoxR-like ATPase
VTQPFAVENYDNTETLFMLAAAMQAPGLERGGGQRVLGLPVLFWGAPGVGKTARGVKMAESLGFKPVIPVLASIRERADFLGIPIPGAFLAPDGTLVTSEVATRLMSAGVKVRPVLAFAPPDWAVKAANGADDNPTDPNARRAAVFFDEFTTAQSGVQAAMLRVIHERVVGDFELPANVVMIAAANPPAMSPGGGTLYPPVANRFIHLCWAPPTPEQWSGFIRRTQAAAGSTIESWPKLDIAAFNVHFRQIQTAVADWVVTDAGRPWLFNMPLSEEAKAHLDRIGTFFTENPGVCFGTPEGESGPVRFTDMYAWPSPRSLEVAIRARAAVLALRPPEGDDYFKENWVDIKARLANEIVCGTIGSAACAELNAYLAAHVRMTLAPESFVTDPQARARFLGRSPSREDLTQMFHDVVAWYRDAPLATQTQTAADFRAAMLGAGGAVESVSFLGSLLPVGEVAAALNAFAAWIKSSEGGQARVVALGGTTAPNGRAQGQVYLGAAGVIKTLLTTRQGQME